VETIQQEVRAARERDPDLFAESRPVEENKIHEILREAVEAACSSIYRAAQGEPRLAGMGTTVTAALLDGHSAYVAHVGDSRCYLARKGRIYQVSEDHSLVNEQLKAGTITAEEARHSRFRNIITRSVGFEEKVLVDMMGLQTEPGDVLVLCCDGLSNVVEDHEILELATSTPLEEAPERLVGVANERGGDDNITVIVVRIDGTGKP
jgi:protein phosphatase